MCKQEEKYCPRCRAVFGCKAGNIAECQCAGVVLSVEEKQFIAERWADCLCLKCLLELKQPGILFKEKYFPHAGR